MKCDMHVHCKCGDPEKIYKWAISKGMDFVTITDHDKIEHSMYLANKYPDKCFSGCEFSVRWEGNKFHILVYDINSKNYQALKSLRHDIKTFREYLIGNNMMHSCAHPYYSLVKFRCIRPAPWFSPFSNQPFVKL